MLARVTLSSCSARARVLSAKGIRRWRRWRRGTKLREKAALPTDHVLQIPALNKPLRRRAD